MRTSLTRAGMLTAAAASLVLGLAACSSDKDGGETAAGAPTDGPATAGEVMVEEKPGDGGPVTTIVGGDGDYAFGVERDGIAEAVASAFESKNATATWEGDTLVVTMDGDAEGMMPGFTECRVITQLILEGDSAAVVFPNGRVECDDT